MKKFLCSALLAALFVSANAQTWSDDSLAMGPNTGGFTYPNDVYYSLENGIVAESPNYTWDLAFSVRNSQFPANAAAGVSILVNTARSAKVWSVPGITSANWASPIDTAGLSTWMPMQNSTTSWDKGALNQNTTANPFDFGWGVYSQATHEVAGDSIFVFRTLGGSFKKLWIKSLGYDTLWHIKHANLDGTGEDSIIFSKKTYPDRNFVYFSASTNSLIDREPSRTAWDFVATRYNDFVTTQFGVGYYPVTGILHNINVKTQQAQGVPVDAAVYDNALLSSDIGTIGWDWKTPPPVTILDSLSYFIQDIPGNIWQLRFTAFGGSSTGKIVFAKRKIESVSVNNVPAAAEVSLYPNPASDVINLTLNNEFTGVFRFSLIDMQGRIVLEEVRTHSGQNSVHSFNLSNHDLNCGIYVARVMSGKTISTARIIVK